MDLGIRRDIESFLNDGLLERAESNDTIEQVLAEIWGSKWSNPWGDFWGEKFE